jgi:hypothetical protein
MARNPKQDANLKNRFDSDQSREEASKNGRKGGKKSGEVRRARRDAKSAIKYLLNLPPTANLKKNLHEMGFPIDEQTNMAALQARLFALAMSGILDAYNTLMKMGGFEPEENRRERESIETNIRRNMEVEAKVSAIGSPSDGVSASLSINDEDGNDDVVIYLPEIDSCDEPDSQS